MRIELVSQLLGQKYFEKVGDKIAQDHRGEKSKHSCGVKLQFRANGNEDSKPESEHANVDEIEEEAFKK